MKIFLILISMCLISLLAIVLPFSAQIDFSENNDKPHIYYSLQSTEFKYSLIVSLSLSIPLLIELFVWVLLMRKSIQIFLQTIAPNTITILLLAVPDLIFLFFVHKSGDIYLFSVVMYARLLLMLCAVFIFISSTGGKIWSHRIILFMSALSSVARVLSFYRIYFPGNYRYYVTELLPIILNLITLITFLYMACRWFHFIYYETKTKPLTTDQYMCSVYTLACAICWLGIKINLVANRNSIDWVYWDVSALTTHTLLFTVFYIFIFVFEGRAMQREMLLTKVSSMHCFNVHLIH